MAIKKGTSAADVIKGTSGDDLLFGYGGDDVLTGGSGADALHGGSGSDTVSGGRGADLLFGGSGDDKLLGDSGDDVLSGGKGDDVLEGGAGGDTLDGGSGDDVLHASSASRLGSWDGEVSGPFREIDSSDKFDLAQNVLRGGSGDDKIYGANGNDAIQGGSGADWIAAAAGTDHIEAGSGDDWVHLLLTPTAGAHDTIDGGLGTDTVTGEVLSFDKVAFSIKGSNATLTGAGAAVATYHDVEIFGISGGLGKDTLDGRGALSVNLFGNDGDDSLIGSSGDDTLYGGRGSDQLSGGAGNDSIQDLLRGTATVDAGAGNDVVSFFDDYNQFEAATASVKLGAGNDRADIVFSLSQDSLSRQIAINGGSGVDTLAVDASSSSSAVTATLAGVTDGPRTITATRIEALDITSGAQDDTLTGGARGDRLYAGSGHDVVFGLGGNDDLGIAAGGKAEGGAGKDHVFVDMHGATAGLDVTLSSATVQVDATTSFTGMESLTFIGGLGNDTVVGGAGADALFDGAGNDSLSGGAGKDSFTRGVWDTSDDWESVGHFEELLDAGIDVIDGGAGFDTLTFASRNVPIDFMKWSSVVYGSAIVDLADQGLNDGLAKGLTVSSIESIAGGVSGDSFRGGSSNDWLSTSAGNDVIDGRGGNDKIDGGSGVDDLTGGAGHDQFLYRAGWDSPFLPYGYGLPEDNGGDHIRDFVRGEDKLVFDMAGATVRSGSTPSWDGKAAQFWFDSDTHELWFDQDGEGAASVDPLRVAVLDNVAKLTAGDFLFT